MKKVFVLLVVAILIINCVVLLGCNKEEEKCDHNYVQGSVKKVATCTKEGEVEYVCSKCGDKITRTYPATGHNFVDGVCTDCGESES